MRDRRMTTRISKTAQASRRPRFELTRAGKPRRNRGNAELALDALGVEFGKINGWQVIRVGACEGALDGLEELLPRYRRWVAAREWIEGPLS